MQVVVEIKAVRPHNRVQCLLPRMTEGRMTHVMRQCESLDQIHIQCKLPRNGPCDLCDFQGMCQPVPKMIGVASGENLGFVRQTPESTGVDNSIAIALEVVSIRMGRLGIATSAGLFDPHRVIGEHANSLLAVRQLAISKLLHSNRMLHSLGEGVESGTAL